MTGGYRVSRFATSMPFCDAEAPVQSVIAIVHSDADIAINKSFFI